MSSSKKPFKKIKRKIAKETKKKPFKKIVLLDKEGNTHSATVLISLWKNNRFAAIITKTGQKVLASKEGFFSRYIYAAFPSKAKIKEYKEKQEKLKRIVQCQLHRNKYPCR